MTDGKYNGPNGAAGISHELAHHGIGGPGARMPLSRLPGEPDRAGVLESIADEISSDSTLGVAHMDASCRIVVHRDGFRYALALVEVRHG